MLKLTTFSSRVSSHRGLLLAVSSLTLSFALSACSGAKSSSADPEMFVEDPGTETATELSVRVSEDIQVDANTQTDLSAEVRIDGLVIRPDSVEWSQLSGPGQAVFSDANALQTDARFDMAGEYVLQLLAYSGGRSSHDTLNATVAENNLNKPPRANAGENLNIEIGADLQLQGIVDDDGLPFSQLSSEWRFVDGPGEAVFIEPSDLKTGVSFSGAGTYTLSLTADDGELIDTDTLQVTVTSIPVVVPDDIPANEPVVANGGWRQVTTPDGSKPIARHEAGAVGHNNALYLFGGRGVRAVSRYSLMDNKWRNLPTPNRQLHHFQPVVYQNKIYILGALDGRFPAEDVIDRIQIYNPANNSWSTGGRLPPNRRRGSAGTVVYKNKIYMIGGNTNGHDGGTVNWFDEYNPATDSWRTLPNAPTARDHFYAAVAGNRLVAAGGRQTDYPATFENLVKRVDVFNFSTGKWEAGAPNIPQARAGTMAVSRGSDVIVIGGETSVAGPASNRVDVYNVSTRKWRSMSSLKQARHGGGAAPLGKQLHVASGNTRQGGGAETTHHEMLQLR